MRTSHREIRKRILEEKSKITDEEFFSSKEYRGYLSDISENASKRYKRPLRVFVASDHDDPTVACTDMDHGTVYINACNEITWSMPSRWLRSLSIEGLLAHEIGHNLFTDGRVWSTFDARLAKGKFYPKMPSGLDGQQKLHAQEILDALRDESDPVPKTVILKTAHALANILEDGYVESRYSHAFPGTPARGIALNNLRMVELAPEITAMVNKQYFDHSIVLNLLIQYMRAGEVNNLSGYTGELLDTTIRLIPVMDESVLDEDPRVRCEAVNRILIKLWPMMQRCFDALRDRQKNAQQSPKNGPATPGSGAGDPGSGQPSEDDGDGSGGEQSGDGEDSGLAAVKAALESMMPNLPQNPTGKSTPVPSNAFVKPGESGQKEALTEMSRVLAEETARIAAHKTEGITSEGDGGVTVNTGYEGSGYEHAAEDIERVLEEMAEGKVHEAMEEELSEELQREADSISYGNAHRGISVTVNRMSHVDQYLIDSYNTVAPDLLMLSKRLQRSVAAILRDKREGGKLTGLLAGKRLNQHALYRDDGRIFCNSRLPTEPINLAVGLLIDESGSMCGNDRITRARATAVIVQDFCEKLGIPIMIMGHTAYCSHVELFSYAEFDSMDKMDRYRIMDMNARDCNRDGAALRFVAEKLHKYPAEVKLLIIICDGQPNDDGYSGTAAEADLRGIKLEYSRKGVQIYAAAIGDDRDRIERIYGSGFLDITDLSQLPVMLTNLIARNLPLG